MNTSFGDLTALPDPMTVAGSDISAANIATDVPGLTSMASALGDMSGFQAAGASGGLGGMLGGLGGSAMGLLGLLGPLIGKKKNKTYPTYGPINGVIGEARPVNVTGTQVAGHSNMIGDLLNMGLSMFTGGFGAGGGMSIGKTFANMGSSMGKNMSSMGGGLSSILGMLGMFSEGGYSTEPVGKRVMDMSAFHSAPAYAEGTPNTSGGMPAILHPNEAVIPLSRGRSIPVDMGDAQMGGHTTVVNSHITVVAPNPDAFRSAQGAIQRKTNRDMKRAAVRNLSPH
jgi:xanthosine utilization system XapX-like protein